ncbi:ROK family protein [Paenibacillus terrigena]|uniref:ROK family protein n=1 Tax=Paenibacillus terrigena TaxID=369333 RepID=UPI0028D41B21|nr:ROK family protein [Paenibacillus terrigena]
MNPYSIVFDVGGTAIKAAVTTKDGQVIESTVETYPAYSNQSRDFLLDYFYQLIQKQASKITDKQYTFAGIGFAYPGPCDYDRGISYIQGLSKYDALYGVSIMDAMRERLEEDPLLRPRMESDYRIIFGNDARLFGVGQWFTGPAKQVNKSLCIMIGTGTGSVFIDHGVAIKNKEIYDHAYRESIIDDYISKRGILKIAEESGVPSKWDVRDIAEAARDQKDESSIAVFHQFGIMLGEVLEPYINEFQPDMIILGGQIAKAGDLFLPSTRAYLREKSPQFHIAENGSYSTFAGISAIIQGISE